MMLRRGLVLLLLVATSHAQLDDYNRVIGEYLSAYTDSQGLVTKNNTVEFQCGNPSHFDSVNDYILNATHGLDGTVYETRINCKTPQLVYDEVLVGWIPPRVEVFSGVVLQSTTSVLNGTWNNTDVTPYSLNGTAKRLVSSKRRVGADAHHEVGHKYVLYEGEEIPSDLVLSNDVYVSPYAGKIQHPDVLGSVRQIVETHRTKSRRGQVDKHEFLYMDEIGGVVHAESGDVLTRGSVSLAKRLEREFQKKAVSYKFGAWGNVSLPHNTARFSLGSIISAAGCGLVCGVAGALLSGSSGSASGGKSPDWTKAINKWMKSNGLSIKAFKAIDGALNRIQKLADDQQAMDTDLVNRDRRTQDIIKNLLEEAQHNSDAISNLGEWVQNEADAVSQNFSMMKQTLEDEITTGIQDEFTWTAGEIRDLRNNVSSQFNTTAVQFNVAMATVQRQIHRVDARVYDQERLFSRYTQAAEVDRNQVRISHGISLAYHLMLEDAKANDLVPWLVNEGTKPWHDPSVFDPDDAIVMVDEMIWVLPLDENPATASAAACSTLHTGWPPADGSTPVGYSCATAAQYSYKLKCNAEFMDRFTHADLPWSFMVLNLNAGSCNTTHPKESEFLDKEMPCKCWVEKQLVSTCKTDFWPNTTAGMRSSVLTPGQLAEDSDFCKTVNWEYVRTGAGEQFTSTAPTDYSTDDTFIEIFTDWVSFQAELSSMCGTVPSLRLATSSHMGTSWDPGLTIYTSHLSGIPTREEDVKMHFSSVHHNMYHEVTYNPTDTCVTDESGIALQHMLQPNFQTVWLFIEPIAWNLAYNTDLKEYANRRYGTVGDGVHLETYSASSLGHVVKSVHRITFVATPKDAVMVPVYMLVPREMQKESSFQITSPTGTGFDTETRVPAIFEADFSFLAPGQVLRVGYKECAGEGNTSPKCDYIKRSGTEGYTFDPPQELLSTGDLPGLLDMRAPPSWPGNTTMYPMLEWQLAHNTSRFNPHDAGYSLSDFYAPITPGTRFCDKGGSIQVNGFWCTTLEKMYWRRYDDGKCLTASDTCLAFRDWRMRAQFVVPFGEFETTRIYGCPVVDVVPQTTGQIQVGMRNMDSHNNTEFVSYVVTRDGSPVIGPISTNIPFGETVFFDVEGTAAGGTYTLTVESGGRLCRETNLTFAQQHASAAHKAATHQTRVEVERAETATQFLGTENNAALARFALSLYQAVNTSMVAHGLAPLPSTGDELDQLKDGMQDAGSGANFTHFNATEFNRKIQEDLDRAAANAKNASDLIDEVEHIDETVKHQLDEIRDDTNALNASVVAAHAALVAAENALSELNHALAHIKSVDDCGFFDMCTWKPILITLGVLVIVVGLPLTIICCVPGCRRHLTGGSAPVDPMLEMMKADYDDDSGDADDETAIEDDPELARLADAQDSTVSKSANATAVASGTTPVDTPAPAPTGVPEDGSTAAAASLPTPPGVTGPLRRNVRLRIPRNI